MSFDLATITRTGVAKLPPGEFYAIPLGPS
jgi:hypothetical protein